MKDEVLICDEENSIEDMPLFDMDISNEECNYSMLQNEYEKLMKKSDCEESESLGRVLNISGISLDKSKRSDEVNRSQRKEVVLEKFDEVLKMLHKYVSIRGDQQPNASINLSRNSESKRVLNNNLF
jgi:hypothetical protein